MSIASLLHSQASAIAPWFIEGAGTNTFARPLHDLGVAVDLLGVLHLVFAKTKALVLWWLTVRHIPAGRTLWVATFFLLRDLPDSRLDVEQQLACILSVAKRCRPLVSSLSIRLDLGIDLGYVITRSRSVFC
jgi:hypothetical protein